MPGSGWLSDAAHGPHGRATHDAVAGHVASSAAPLSHEHGQVFQRLACSVFILLHRVME